jgi:hypothetical protein
VLAPSEAGIAQIVEAFLSDNRLLQEAAVVEVQNGTGEQGQASKAVDYFISLGIPTTSLVAVNATTANHTKTEIIEFTGKRYTAELLARWMGLPRDRVRQATDDDIALRNSEADIVVILGADAKLESAVVQQTR